MNCKNIQNSLDDYLNDTLQPQGRDHMDSHLNECGTCQEALDEHVVLREQLAALPVPPATQGFNARVMRRGRQHGQMHSARLRVAGGMLGAFLVVLVAVGLWKPEQTEISVLQTISMQVFETKTVSLAFNSPSDMNDVAFTLQLPEGVELEGRPAQTQLAWTSHLREGRNVMNLNLKGNEQLQGDLIARIKHNGLEREFRVSLKVDGVNGAEISPPINFNTIS